MRRLGWAMAGMVAFAAAGCSNDVLDLSAGDGTGGDVFPRYPWDAGPTPIPSSTPLNEFGDGHDGPLTVAGTQTVNACGRISATAASTVTVEALTFGAIGGGVSFASGDRVLLWQVQDEFATSGSTAVVTTASMAMAGTWQMARVTAVGSTSIDVDLTPLSYRSGDGYSAQACRVPEYTDVTVPVTTRIESPTWSPTTGGGLVAFFVSGTLTVDGTISASGRGFTGGNAHLGSNQFEDIVVLETLAADGGSKGHGLDGRSGELYGSGNWANAAGGGNAHSAGGGGGGNGGAGGLGGKQWKPTGDVAGTAGRAGSSVIATYPSRLVMGGGGGEAQGHHDGTGDAGDGGGLVLVFANALAGTGSFFSDGDLGAPSTNDAGSGGGAGGTIVVRAASSSFSGLFRANGGNGADAVFDGGVGDEEISGPGGGGGGGWIHFITGSAGVVPTLRANGGANGVNLLGDDDPWGATAGTDGVAAMKSE